VAKRLPDNPDLEQYRRQAKDLRKALAAGDPAAFERLRAFHPRADRLEVPKLADVQLVLAREHGFAGWPSFAAHLRAQRAGPGGAMPGKVACETGTLTIEVAGADTAKAMVLFILAGNVGRRHLGIRQIAHRLRLAGYGTVLADLLTPEEAARDAVDEELRFDVPLLAARAGLVLDRLKANRTLANLPLALFCAGTGGAAGVLLIAQRPSAACALVSLAGRPDLAGSAVARMRVPTLFVVGSEDAVGHGFTRTMLEIFPRDVPSRLEVVRGVGLRFEEGPAAARAAELALDWLENHLRSHTRREQAA
jgi:hypothetical protein